MMERTKKKFDYSIFLMFAVAVMSYLDYSQDGDRVYLAFAIVAGGLVLYMCFDFFRRPKDAED